VGYLKCTTRSKVLTEATGIGGGYSSDPRHWGPTSSHTRAPEGLGTGGVYAGVGSKSASFLAELPEWADDDDGAPEFGTDLPDLGAPRMENTDRTALPPDPDPRITTKVERRRMVELVMGDNAAAKLGALPAPGEATHLRLDGSFNGVDVLFGVLKLLAPATISTLYLASLSFNRRVGERLLEAIDAGHVGRCVFLSSSMFAGKERGVVDWMSAELARRGSRLVSARSHVKLLLAETTDGRKLVIESSYNLRTCSCWEQAVLCDDPALFRWHADFIERM
jgi:hypothetical protein